MSNIPLHERANWVGASESAALFDASPFTTRFELWQYKARRLLPDSLDDQERIQAGQFLEPSIGAWAAHKWDLPVVNVREYLQHPKVGRMGASLDFAADGEPVEIKNVDGLRFRDGDWASEGDEIFDAPLHYLIQVQHQLACTPQASGAWLVVCIGGNQLKRMRVERHPGMIERIEEEVDAFWQSVDRGDPPDPDYVRDYEAINRLFGGEQEVADLRHDDEAYQLCQEWADANRVEREAKDRKKAAMARLKVLGGDARRVIMHDGWTMTASHIQASVREFGAYWRFALKQSKQES